MRGSPIRIEDFNIELKRLKFVVGYHIIRTVYHGQIQTTTLVIPLALCICGQMPCESRQKSSYSSSQK
jgi:hypothetical protein